MWECKDHYTHGNCSVDFAGKCSDPLILAVCQETCGVCSGSGTQSEGCFLLLFMHINISLLSLLYLASSSPPLNPFPGLLSEDIRKDLFCFAVHIRRRTYSSRVQRRTGDQKVAGSIPGRSGWRTFPFRVSFLC